MKKDTNVLFILCDQFRQDIPGFNGNRVVKTPNLDKLASISSNFKNAHTICPLCSPARGALLSGCEPQINGVIDNLFVGSSNQKPLGSEVNTWLKESAKNGFQTGYFGKWHLGEWDYKSNNVTFDMSAPEFTDSRIKKYSRATAKGELREGVVQNEMKDWNRDGKLDEAYKMPFYGKLDNEKGMRDYKTCTKVVDFINNTDSNSPWSVTASFKSPHFPLGIPEPYFSMYDPKEIKLPKNFKDNFQNKPWFQNRHWWPLITDRFTEDDWKKTIAAYYGLVTMTDYWIGQILDAAKENSHGKDTVVIFTADHGEMLSSHSRFDKAAYFYEEVMRIPLLICKDLNGKNSVKEDRMEYTSTLDTSKTLYNLLGSDGEKGRNLIDLIDGKSKEEFNDEVFSEYHRYNSHLFEIRMISTPKYKYCFNPQDIDELYDLENDKDELFNLSDDENYADIKRDLKKRLLAHLEKLDDNILQTLDSMPPAGCVL
jgi:arylsulfatase A-like enzyme